MPRGVLLAAPSGRVRREMDEAQLAVATGGCDRCLEEYKQPFVDLGLDASGIPLSIAEARSKALCKYGPNSFGRHDFKEWVTINRDSLICFMEQGT